MAAQPLAAGEGKMVSSTRDPPRGGDGTCQVSAKEGSRLAVRLSESRHTHDDVSQHCLSSGLTGSGWKDYAEREALPPRGAVSPSVLFPGEQQGQILAAGSPGEESERLSIAA
ncbi:hypothetical protein A4R35_00155 [Thermogemmatispora tikiterensis]|uniref:Uncharacterized protein n=1 Tax=Thermogemmatispora tikiterensis TaxID=1825093 RepID=A0A328VD98_9CHLR|nr:hypothetical protein A4R35_00155 [Thermogemmatispora tikiterensis]